MNGNIAINATLVNPETCDNRAFLDAAISAILPAMDEIDGAWIRKRLTGERGEQTRLAEHLHISTDKLSKTLSGKRSVQPDEIPLLLSFFGERIVSNTSDDAQLLERIGRLNRAGQEVLRRQLDALLETPELVQPDRNTRRED